MFGANRVTVGYFAQHQLDELNPLSTPFDYVVKLMPEATEAQRRTKLGTWGFGADKADTKCSNLSGGEKARLLLALTAFHAPHLLILDEPTNHLDVDSREALIHAIAEYEGAVILISHDRHLVEATADRLWIVAGGTVRSYDGDMDSYRTELLQTRSPKAERRSNGDAPRKRAQAAPTSAKRPPNGAPNSRLSRRPCRPPRRPSKNCLPNWQSSTSSWPHPISMRTPRKRAASRKSAVRPPSASAKPRKRGSNATSAYEDAEQEANA